MAKQLLWVDVDAFWESFIKLHLTASEAFPILDTLCFSQGDQADFLCPACRSQEPQSKLPNQHSDSRRELSI